MRMYFMITCSFKSNYACIFEVKRYRSLCLHRTIVDCYDNDIKCLNDNGENRILQGNKNPTSVRMIIALQDKHNRGKGCDCL